MDLPPKTRPYGQGMVIVSAIVLLIGLIITAFAWRYTRDSVTDTAQDQFIVEVGQIEYALTKRISSYYNILYALQGLFAASDSVERREWNPFVETAKIADYPDIEYVSYIEIVKNDNKVEFAENVRSDKSVNSVGYPNVSIYPESSKDEYAVIKYIDPENEESIRVLGYDIYSSPPRKVALDKAAETNQPVASELINLAIDNSQGFVITAPIYENGKSINTVEERRSALKGFVSVSIKTSSLFANIFPLEANPDVTFTIYDGGELLHTSEARDDSGIDMQTHTDTKTLEIGGRVWTLEVSSLPSFEKSLSRTSFPSVVGLGGISVSLLLFLIIYYYGKRTSQLIQLQSAALRTAANGVAITDTNGIIQWVNPAFSALTGYEAYEVIGQSTRILKSSKQDREFYQNLWETITAGKSWRGELTNKRKDGSLYQEEQTITPVTDSKGKVKNFISIKQDVTPRKMIEEKMLLTHHDLGESKKAIVNILEDLNAEKVELAQEKVKADAILKSVGEGLIVTDKEGKILTVNDAFEKLLGWDRAEVIGRDMLSIVPKYDESDRLIPPKSRSITKVLTGRIKKGSVSTLATTHYYLRRDKTKLPIVGVVTPIFLQGQIFGAVQVFRDISVEKEINSMKDEFLNIAAHDLRTPMAAIRGFISRVLDGDAGEISDKAKDLLQSAYEGNLRLVSLVDDFLNVSRIERGKVQITPVAGNLSECVETVMKELKSVAEDKGLFLEYQRCDLPKVLLDSEKIVELLVNLVGNAVQFTKKGGITISHKVSSKEVVTRVSDTGIGISKDIQQHIFEKYFKSNSQKIEQSGLGLGLYISKLILDGHGGKIWFESEEGKGSTFLFSLPIVK